LIKEEIILYLLGADPALPVEGVNESPEAQTEVTEEVNIQ
jgi:hypothetical protein